jgi:cytochrome c peroxidase
MKLGVVSAYPALSDSGRIKVTGSSGDLFVFKVPSLRNIEKTGPYFHDGSVASLDGAIRLMARHQLGKELTDAEVADIRTYLASLTGRLPVDYIGQPPRPAT